MIPLPSRARTLVLEIAAIVVAITLLSTLAYGPRTRRAGTLSAELSQLVAENERLGGRIADQGDVAAEIETLRAAAERFRSAKLLPGHRGDTSALLRRIAGRNGLSVSKESAWSGAPSDKASATLIRKELSLRGPFAACAAFVAETESLPEGFVVERLAVRREGGREGGSVAMEIRLLAVESDGSGQR